MAAPGKSFAVVAILAVAVTGCASTPVASLSRATSPSDRPTPSASPSAAASLEPSLDPSVVPSGRIAYMRLDPDGIERYFTVDSLGSNEHALYETQHCACIRWSTDGTEIWTITETDTGLSFTTMDPDGSNRVVHESSISGLNLVPAYGSSDGKVVSFLGFSDVDPTLNGVYVAAPDLAGLHRVTSTPDGVQNLDPVGMSPDGSELYFFGDTGGDGKVTHAGNLYAIGADGDGLRQINPPGTRTWIQGAAMSPDGRSVAFGAWAPGEANEASAMYTFDVASAELTQIVEAGDLVTGIAWSPAGDQIGYSIQIHGGPSETRLMASDGSRQRSITAEDKSAEIGLPAWSPDGTHLLVRRGPRFSNDLWIIDLDGRFVWQVTHHPAGYDVFAWAGMPRD